MDIRSYVMTLERFVRALIAFLDIASLFQPSPQDHLALERLRSNLRQTDTPMQRARSFVDRALSHARYSAGQFHTPSSCPAA